MNNKPRVGQLRRDSTGTYVVLSVEGNHAEILWATDEGPFIFGSTPHVYTVSGIINDSNDTVISEPKP